METLTCKTPGHEDKPQHGKAGLCQACYRRDKRQERGLQKPGPKPDPSKPFSRLNPESRHYPGGSIMCGNGHGWEDGSHIVRSDGRKVCLLCIEGRKGDMCPAGLHLRAESMNKYGQCRPCAARRQIAYRLKAKYGLTVEQFEAMLVEQDMRCAICREEFDLDAHNGVCMDHDHSCCPGEYTCGKCLRKILCDSCNKLIGNARDDIARLQAAIAYLREYQPR